MLDAWDWRKAEDRLPGVIPTMAHYPLWALRVRLRRTVTQHCGSETGEFVLVCLGGDAAREPVVHFGSSNGCLP